jgi:hypothetical protein
MSGKDKDKLRGELGGFQSRQLVKCGHESRGRLKRNEEIKARRKDMHCTQETLMAETRKRTPISPLNDSANLNSIVCLILLRFLLLRNGLMIGFA